MRNYIVSLIIIFLLGCELQMKHIQEAGEFYQLKKNTAIILVLQTRLSSNVNQRGDTFAATLKEPLKLNNKTILPQNTKINGLIKRASKYEKFGDRASIALLFDQLVLSEDRKIPIQASLDTEKGANAITIKGKGMKDASIVGGTAIIGAMIGKAGSSDNDNYGANKGLVMGAAMGTGAVLLSNRKEIILPVGAEIMIKLEEDLLIPRN